MKLNEVTRIKAGDLERVKMYTSGNLHIPYKNLTSLEGCPKEVTGGFSCLYNLLTSLEHSPERVHNDYYVTGNKFTSFKDIDKYIHYMHKTLFARDMDITSGFADLFGIDGLKRIEVSNKQIETIVNKYLEEKDLINFQDEMIKTGLESYL